MATRKPLFKIGDKVRFKDKNNIIHSHYRGNVLIIRKLTAYSKVLECWYCFAETEDGCIIPVIEAELESIPTG